MNRIVRTYVLTLTLAGAVVAGAGATMVSARADGEVVTTGGNSVTTGPLPSSGVPMLPKPGEAIPSNLPDPTLPPQAGTTAPTDGIPDPGTPTAPGAGQPSTDPGAGQPSTDPGTPTNPGSGDMISQLVQLVMSIIKMFMK